MGFARGLAAFGAGFAMGAGNEYDKYRREKIRRAQLQKGVGDPSLADFFRQSSLKSGIDKISDKLKMTQDPAPVENKDIGGRVEMPAMPDDSTVVVPKNQDSVATTSAVTPQDDIQSRDTESAPAPSVTGFEPLMFDEDKELWPMP